MVPDQICLMTEADKDFSYDHIADSYAAGVDTAPYNAHYERPATLDLVPNVAGAHILDAGCGSGFYTETLLERGARVTAVDGSREMVKHARERLTRLGFVDSDTDPNARVSLRTFDLGKPLDFLEDESVDGIVSALVMHYLRDWAPTLVEYRRILKPRGWLVMSTHHPATEAHRFDIVNYFLTQQLEDRWDWAGKVRFFRRPLTATIGALTSAGFVIDALVEPLPTKAFWNEKPEAYQRLLRHPEFIIIRARISI
jgi:SAM-dependent methyltransferase